MFGKGMSFLKETLQPSGRYESQNHECETTEVSKSHLRVGGLKIEILEYGKKVEETYRPSNEPV